VVTMVSPVAERQPSSLPVEGARGALEGYAGTGVWLGVWRSGWMWVMM